MWDISIPFLILHFYSTIENSGTVNIHSFFFFRPLVHNDRIQIFHQFYSLISIIRIERNRI